MRISISSTFIQLGNLSLAVQGIPYTRGVHYFFDAESYSSGDRREVHSNRELCAGPLKFTFSRTKRR